MDIALNWFDDHLGDALYAKLNNPFTSLAAASTSALAAKSAESVSPGSSLVNTVVRYLADVPGLDTLPRNSIVRQSLSLWALTYVGIILMYFSIAGASYYFIFDHRMMLHPRFLKNQVRREINFSLESFPPLVTMTVPWFVGDVRGHSMLYDSMAEGPFGAEGGWKPWAYMVAASAAFLFFTDYTIYWIHRCLHIPVLYKRLHKPHHRWIIPTPFASHAFHPIDGYLQSVPYHLACYLFPIHKYLFVGLFTFVNLWSIFIHDSDMLCGHAFEHYINGPAHHTLHHIYFSVNYGQYFTWADKVGGSFRQPAKGDDPMDAVLDLIAKREAESGKKVTQKDVYDIVDKLEAEVAHAAPAVEVESDDEGRSSSASDSGIGSDLGTPRDELEKEHVHVVGLLEKKRQ